MHCGNIVSVDDFPNNAMRLSPHHYVIDCHLLMQRSRIRILVVLDNQHERGFLHRCQIERLVK